jgi:hypothetical protein
MDENELANRLRTLGEEPVPPADRARHLQRIADTPTPSTTHVGRLWIAAAAIVGFLVGSTGLAAADALPDPAQDVAHDVLAVVQVDVPEGNRGACVSSIARSDLSKAEKKAAKDACPKGGAGANDGEAPGRSGSAPGHTKHAEDPCRGKPPWAGRPDLSPEQKAALKAETAAACGRGAPDDETEEPEVEEPDTETPGADTPPPGKPPVDTPASDDPPSPQTENVDPEAGSGG